MTIGIEHRIARVLPSNFSLILAIDDALINGPTIHLTDVGALVSELDLSLDFSVLGFPGALARWMPNARPARIGNLTASTSLSNSHLRKRLVASVEGALNAGCDAIAAHINFCSETEGEQIEQAAHLFERAHAFGLPCLAIAYIRRESRTEDMSFNLMRTADPDAHGKLVAHAARASLEIGSDIIKIPKVGSAEIMQSIVKSVAPVPVLIAGGEYLSDADLSDFVTSAKLGGSSGIALGRNIHQAADLQSRTALLKSLLRK